MSAIFADRVMNERPSTKGQNIFATESEIGW